MEGWGDLKAVHQNPLLALEEDVTGPTDEAGQIALMLDALANTETTGTLLEERVLLAVSLLLDFL